MDPPQKKSILWQSGFIAKWQNATFFENIRPTASGLVAWWFGLMFNVVKMEYRFFSVTVYRTEQVNFGAYGDQTYGDKIIHWKEIENVARIYNKHIFLRMLVCCVQKRCSFFPETIVYSYSTSIVVSVHWARATDITFNSSKGRIRGIRPEETSETPCFLVRCFSFPG